MARPARKRGSSASGASVSIEQPENMVNKNKALIKLFQDEFLYKRIIPIAKEPLALF